MTRRDRGVAGPGDRAGKKFGETKGSNGEFFLETVLLLNRMTRDDIEPVHLKPTALVEPHYPAETLRKTSPSPPVFSTPWDSPAGATRMVPALTGRGGLPAERKFPSPS